MSGTRIPTAAQPSVRAAVVRRVRRAWSVPLAWSLLVLIVLLRAVSIALNLVNSVRDPGGLVVESVVFVFPAVGAVIALSRPKNPIGWIFLTGFLGPSLHGFAQQYAIYTLTTRPNALPGGAAMASLTLWVGNLGFGLITLTLLLFPTGHLPSRRWRPVFVLMALLLGLQNILGMITPGPIEDVEGVLNPLGFEEAGGVIQALRNIIDPLYGVTIAAAALSLILRFLRAQGEERQQIKWVAYAMMLLVSFIVGVALAPPLPQLVIDSAFVVVATSFPISVGIAILRYRLYDIDVIIRRTLVYSVLSAALALIYFGCVVLLQRVASSLGATADSPLAVVISTLAIATLFQPLRRGIQTAIDRRFYRRKYDAARTLQAFSANLRDEVDVNRLSQEMVQVVQETLQPEHASLWLREAGPRARQQ